VEFLEEKMTEALIALSAGYGVMAGLLTAFFVFTGRSKYDAALAIFCAAVAVSLGIVAAVR
jgi:hypothetical protein